ncbi:hypothetical protein ACFFJB_00835 [Camelimonas abortus]|uniref:Uncharacterized protein n=1 Tax=Camelimonas abortus TaxID=1017184 RepID=A0ABV7LB01_9HYPH
MDAPVVGVVLPGVMTVTVAVASVVMIVVMATDRRRGARAPDPP